MTRPLEHKSNWRVYLDALLFARLQTPFRWGTNDCALFAADAVRDTTGVDLAVDLRGYSTARQALRIIRACGGLPAIATRALGEPIPSTYACTGDVALVPASNTGKRLALAVCVSAEKAASPGADGLQFVPMHHAHCVWRVG
jgi:hypothetical protein